MNNIEKLLRAFIEAQGFDVEEVKDDVFMGNYSGADQYQNKTVDYKVTKRADTALSLLREIVDGDTDYTNGYNLGVDLFNRIKDLVNE